MSVIPDERPLPAEWQEIGPILQALCEFEKKSVDQDIKSRHFAIRQTWLANDAYLPRLAIHFLTLSKPAIPGLFQKHIFGLLLARIRNSGRYRKLASQAAAIQLKTDGNRLRAFFLPTKANPDGSCLKIIPKRDGIAQKTRAEIAFRKKLTELKCITVPKIKAVNEDANYLYVSEELVQGERYRHRRHGALFINQGIPELCAMYIAAGIYFSPLDTFYSISLLNRIKAIFGGSSAADSFIQELENAFRLNPDIPISACHNDLLPSNLGVAQGKLYFFDWELVSEGPIFADLLKLPFKYDRMEEMLQTIAEKMKQHFPAVNKTYSLHFAVYIADRIVKNEKKRDRFLSLWKLHKEKFEI